MSGQFGIRFTLLLGSDCDLQLVTHSIVNPFHDGKQFSLREGHLLSFEKTLHRTRIVLEIDSFDSVDQADCYAEKIHVAILWTSLSQFFSIKFDEWNGDKPYVVVNRRELPGVKVIGEGRAYFTVPQDTFVATLQRGFSDIDTLPQHLVTSLEMYAAIRFEATERARFIAVITALEALADQRKYGKELDPCIQALLAVVSRDSFLSENDNERLKTSLIGRIRDLRRESVRQAIVRTVEQVFGDEPSVRAFIEHAYGVRSDMLHEGQKHPQVSELLHQMELIMRKFYSHWLRMPLARDIDLDFETLKRLTPAKG